MEVKPALDMAASEMWNGEAYVYQREGVNRSTGEQVDFVKEIIDNYGFYYIEDPIREDDFDGFAELTRKAGNKCLICGDDLYVTNAQILQEGINKKSANSIIIKPNQIGTLTDTYQTVELARNNKVVPVVSHRSGETTDETIAHLAVAWSCPIIKTGATGGERIAKLNELIRIEEEITDPAMGRIEKYR